MNLRFLKLLGVLLIVIGMAAVDSADAFFVVVDNFDGLTPGPIDDQNGWTAPHSTSEVTSDPDDEDNLVLSVITDSTWLFREALILNGTVRMLFLRFRYEDQLNFSLGMSYGQYPTQFGDFEVELSMTNSTSDLRINDDGSYETLTTLQSGVWYNCWLLIDNLGEATQVWLHDRDGEGATLEDQLDAEGQTSFVFRSATARDLQTFFIKTGGGQGLQGPLYIDDIYLENTDALNLSNPSAVPTAVGDLPTTVGIRSISPNPFNPRTNISFTLVQDEAATIAVYRLTGERVAVLANGVLSAGDHTFVWDGRDTMGRAVASGSYLFRLETSAGAAVKKAMLVR